MTYEVNPKTSNQGPLMRKILKLTTILTIILFCSSVYVWYDYVAFEKQHFVSPRAAVRVNNNEIKIGIIGESWAAGRKIDDYLIVAMQDKGVVAYVTSQGHPGAKSKLVYQDLFKPDIEEYSSNHVLYGEPIDICIVLTGVNDTASYVGADFYSYHLNLIVSALITRGITPLVVEIPEYGIEETDSKSLHGKIRRRLMRLVHDNNQIDIIPKYRKFSKQQLMPDILKEEIIYFPFQSVSSDYLSDKNLYRDDLLHLNDDGNKKLALEISKVIKKWLSNQSTRTQ